MSLEISDTVTHAVDIVLLTFILVWRERQSERMKSVDMVFPDSRVTPPMALLVDGGPIIL